MNKISKQSTLRSAQLPPLRNGLIIALPTAEHGFPRGHTEHVFFAMHRDRTPDQICVVDVFFGRKRGNVCFPKRGESAGMGNLMWLFLYVVNLREL